MDARTKSTRPKPRLLVVEDDEDYRMILQRALEPLADARGWEAVFLGGVAEGEAAMRRTSVDLLISDYHLPDGLGTTLTRAAQASPAEPHRVILTSDPFPAQHAWRDEPDLVDEIWEKPWDPRSVALRIAVCMDVIEDAARASPAARS